MRGLRRGKGIRHGVTQQTGSEGPRMECVGQKTTPCSAGCEKHEDKNEKNQGGKKRGVDITNAQRTGIPPDTTGSYQKKKNLQRNE